MPTGTRPITRKEYEFLVDRLTKLGTSVEQLKTMPASKARATPGKMFAPKNPQGAWPSDRLKSLAKAYPNDAHLERIMKSRNGQVVGVGWGQALQRIAQIDRKANSKYTDDDLQKEFGFIPTEKYTKRVNGEIQKVALAENSGVTGGYIVPPQVSSELLAIASEDAWIEPKARVVPMTSRTMQFPILDVTTAQSTGYNPYLAGIYAKWQPEASSIAESEPAFRMTDFTAWDLVLYTVSSNQLLNDNAVALDSLLTDLFATGITWYREYAYLRGTGAGSSMPLGVINAPATYVQTRATSNEFSYADAAAMFSRLQARSRETACWSVHQSVLPELIKMNSGGTAVSFLVWVNPTPNGPAGPAGMRLPNAFLNGLPLFITDKQPALGTTGDVVLCDWSQYIIGDRMDLQIDVSTHALFRNNQTAWRVVSRLDGKPWLNSTITDPAGFVVSPFVALSSATS